MFSGAINTNNNPRQVPPCADSPLMPTAKSLPAQAPVSQNHLQSLSNLYKATNVTVPQPLDKNHYGNLKFWDEHKWAEWVGEEKEKGTFKNCQGQGVNSSWMENTAGDHVGLSIQRDILHTARTVWTTMALVVGLDIYSKMPVTTLDYFRAKMESDHLELQLCANHWKADKLWKENFSSWKQSHQEKNSNGPARQRKL